MHLGHLRATCLKANALWVVLNHCLKINRGFLNLGFVDAVGVLLPVLLACSFTECDQSSNMKTIFNLCKLNPFFLFAPHPFKCIFHSNPIIVLLLESFPRQSSACAELALDELRHVT